MIETETGWLIYWIGTIVTTIPVIVFWLNGDLEEDKWKDNDDEQ